jgi:uncharacterized damage-inducible protein DinB
MSMLTVFQKMAVYNQWMNGKLYAASERLSDAERKADKGAFFKSLHGTLNHLLWADLTWLKRLIDYPVNPPPIGQEMYADFTALKQARQETDDFIIRWTAQDLSEDWLNEPFVWRSGADGMERRQPRWLLVQHMFNHQTHHRGQATTLLTQAGVDIGVTDLARM